MNEVIRTILSRRSTRIFKEDPLKDEEIGQILEAAKYAPSGTNQQPWNFTVVSNKELIEEIGLESKNVAKQSENKHLRDLANNDKFRPFY
ncbi:MAG: nitroreductase family protein, partial [Leptotrichiaceae bacterium]